MCGLLAGSGQISWDLKEQRTFDLWGFNSYKEVGFPTVDGKSKPTLLPKVHCGKPSPKLRASAFAVNHASSLFL